MKKGITAILLAVLLLTMAGCSQASDRNAPQSQVPLTPNTAQGNTGAPPASPSAKQPSQTAVDTVSKPVIRISDGKNVVNFRLNNSKAAKNLYEQLPLSIKVEDYSNNEKIFYPPKALDVSDAPKAGGKVGTLAYYKPWDDVVMFFGSYSPNSSLYELGQVVSGSEQIQSLTGTITVEAAP